MSDEMKEYLSKIKFDKYFEKLKQKVKNKTTIIYGIGILFQYVRENYDLSSINIIGVSDKKYSPEEEGREYLGYKIIPKNKMINYNPDIIIVSAKRYVNIISGLEQGDFYNTKTKIYPLARIPFWDLIKEIWL